jgi:hypothetical protein
LHIFSYEPLAAQKRGEFFNDPDFPEGYLPGFFWNEVEEKFWGNRKSALRDLKGGLEKGPKGAKNLHIIYKNAIIDHLTPDKPY